MAISRENSLSLVGTIVFHAILLAGLLFFYIKPVADKRYSAEDGGVPVMLGNAADAYGNDEPNGEGNGLDEDLTEPINTDLTEPNHIEQSETEQIAEEPQPEPTESETKEEPTPIKSKEKTTPPVTQDMDETVRAEREKKIADKKQKEIAELKRKADEATKAKQKADAERKLQNEAKLKAEAELARKKNINSQLAGVFGNGSGNSGNRGNTQGTGTQGSPSGNGNTGKVSGVGGIGSYDLGGRGLGSGGLKLPSYNVNDYGTVVVDILVDPKGNVIETSIGRGTNTVNASLRSESLKAARHTRFSAVTTANNQRGTITYRFNLN